MQLNLFRIAYPVTSLGPGKRVVIWVAGCRTRCPGCISPEMQDPAAGELIDTAVLANHLLKLPHALDGITISGGEAFDQAEALAELLGALKLGQPEWTVMVYTGYCLRTVRKKEKCRSLLEMADIVIDGPYRQDKPSQHPWAGSGNQRVFLLKEKRMLKCQIAVYQDIEANVGYGVDDELYIVGVMEKRSRIGIRDVLKGDKNGIQNCYRK